MAKSKENTTVNENGRIRFALYTDESTMDLVDKHYKEDGCGCKSEYITKAIQYYAELHSLGDCSHVVPDIITSTLKDITRESDNRQGRLLFKMAVELTILQNIAQPATTLTWQRSKECEVSASTRSKSSTVSSLLMRRSDGKAKEYYVCHHSPPSTIDNLLITLAVAAGYSVEPVISLWYAKTDRKIRKNEKIWQTNADRRVTARYTSARMGDGKRGSSSVTRRTAVRCTNRSSPRRRRKP